MAYLPFRRAQEGDEEGHQATHPSEQQRRWEVAALLSSLSPEVRAVLEGWLLAPTDYNRWPPPVFQKYRQPLSWREKRGVSRGKVIALLYEEVRAVRQTLDFPPQGLSGLTRNGLLVVHGIRLRQLQTWLHPREAARVLREMIAA
jgi:hypothetical protein